MSITTHSSAASRLRAMVVLLVAVSMLVGVGAVAQAAEPTQEYEFVVKINEERRASGLKELPIQSQLTSIARDWSVQMAKDGAISHRPDLATVVKGDWTALGENVGVGGSVGSLHQAFMDSPGHAKNVLGNWDHVGVGVVFSGGRLWVTVNFSRGQIEGTATLASAPPPEMTAEFGDVYADGAHAEGILAIYAKKVTSGCATGKFCPNGSVTRAQMATYVTKALGLAASGTSTYSDVPSTNVHTGSIDAVTKAGVMGACAAGKFCPNDPVLRAEMAQILTDAFGLQASKTWSFTDVPSGSQLAGHVSAIADAGVTTGCTATTYCPDLPVSRGQMATFLARALGLI